MNNELFIEYFNNYQVICPSNMYKKLIEIENAEINQTKVDFIKKILIKLQKTVNYVPKDNTFMLKRIKRY